MPQSDIVIRGAREHNLQDVSLKLPSNKLICMTGVSGSGKSSLAFDTLYAEGQRRYVESLSSYARQFLGQMPKPEVDPSAGWLPRFRFNKKPAAAIPAAPWGPSPRSTIISACYLRGSAKGFARVRRSHHRPDQRTNHREHRPASRGHEFQILAPLIRQQKGEFRDLFEDLLKQGFLRASVDGEIVQLTDNLQLDRQMRHTIEVIIDRLTAGKTSRQRLAEAVEAALKLTGGTLLVRQGSRDKGQEPDWSEQQRAEGGEPENLASAPDSPLSTFDSQLYSAHYSCPKCQLSYEPPGPQLFSFNSPLGMCLDCNGLGIAARVFVGAFDPQRKTLHPQRGD